MNKKDLRIVFMGTPKIAAGVLRTLIENEYNIVAVVTQPDTLVGRKQVLTFSEVKKVAMEYNIPVVQPKSIRKEPDEVLSYEPDFILTLAYGQFIPDVILNYPKYGITNLHGSLLPKRRGGAPIQWSVIEGDKETGMTFMYMRSKMDSGEILSQRAIPIEIDDTSSTMFDKLEELSKEMILEDLPKFIDGELVPVPQNEEEVTFSLNLSKDDEYINFERDVMTVYNHIRGLLDNPGAYSIIDGKKIKFHKVRFTDKTCEPGLFNGLEGKAIQIGCLNGSILVDEIQPEGKNRMGAKDFMNGAGRNLVGKKFEEKN